jgi:hypothetical protein
MSVLMSKIAPGNYFQIRFGAPLYGLSSPSTTLNMDRPHTYKKMAPSPKHVVTARKKGMLQRCSAVPT